MLKLKSKYFTKYLSLFSKAFLSFSGNKHYDVVVIGGGFIYFSEL